MIKVMLSNDITHKLPMLKIGLVEYQNVTITDSPAALKGRIQFFLESLQLEYRLGKMAEIPQINYHRSCFKALGMDPSRYSPSSEALLRRVLQGKGLPFIHSAADMNNFFSLTNLSPCGLYDLDLLKGNELVMRLGQNKESYISLAGKETKVENKWITSDLKGPFGSPIIDSDRTKVTHSSKNLLHIIYFPSTIQNEIEGEKSLYSLAEMFLQMNGGEIKQIKVVSSS